MAENIYRHRVKPSGGFELFAWYFMRISGVVLLFMALIHYAIMHILYDITEINFAFVAERYTTMFWPTFDWIMLLLALIHGVNGIRYIIDDYIHPPGIRIFVLSVLYILSFILLILGTMAIITFDPAKFGVIV